MGRVVSALSWLIYLNYIQLFNRQALSMRTRSDIYAHPIRYLCAPDQISMHPIQISSDLWPTLQGFSATLHFFGTGFGPFISSNRLTWASDRAERILIDLLNGLSIFDSWVGSDGLKEN